MTRQPTPNPVDLFQRAGLRIWGPNLQAAQFESSKVFSQKNAAARYGRPFFFAFVSRFPSDVTFACVYSTGSAVSSAAIRSDRRNRRSLAVTSNVRPQLR